MPGRSTQTSRRRTAASSRATTTTRGRTTTTGTRARPAYRRRQTNSMGALVGRAGGALWMGVAHSVGWLVRGLGRQAATARDLDPEHRRDGAGLLLLGLSILTSVASNATGATRSSQASCRPRTSGRRASGRVRLSQSALPSPPYRLAVEPVTVSTNSTPISGSASSPSAVPG
jgi:hypothetical protein